MKLTKGSAVRYIVLLLALINQWLADKGLSPIPIELKQLKYEKKQPTTGKAPSDFDADKDGQI